MLGHGRPVGHDLTTTLISGAADSGHSAARAFMDPHSSLLLKSFLHGTNVQATIDYSKAKNFTDF